MQFKIDIDFLEYKVSRKSGWGRWEHVKGGFKTREDARLYVELIRDLPEYL